MNSIHSILANHQHRPYSMPAGRWRYYQEWNDALFLHWKIDPELLAPHIPKGLQADCFDGSAYISIVAFAMQQIRPRHLPAVAMLSDFYEINLRTYITHDGKPGVYFLNMEAGKDISAWLARSISGLPYRKSFIQRSASGYKSLLKSKGFSLHADFEIKDHLYQKTALDKWLIERYCLYMDHRNNLYRYDIHHAEWALQEVNMKKLEVVYKVGDTLVTEHHPDLIHYSPGVKVLAWKKEKLDA